MKKFLIIGGNSKLARCFQEIYGREIIGLSKSQCDVTSEKSLREAISKFRGKYVLNCAAVTDIEECEKNPTKCFSVNVSGVYLLNRVCLELGKKLIHVSSDYALNPMNSYGWSKYLSEKIVDKNFLVVRTNFYNSETFMVKNLLKRKRTEIFKNMYFNPISINNLAKEIYRLRERKGVFNLFTSKKISYLQFANLFCQVFGLKEELVQPVSYEYKGGAKRPFISWVKPDMKLSIKQDLINFKKYYENQF